MKNRSNLPLLFIFAFLYLLLNWYVISGLQVYTEHPLLSLTFWLLIALVTLSLVYAVKRIGSRGMDAFFKFATHAFLILISVELIFILALLPGDVYRLFTHAPRNLYWVEFSSLLALITLCIFIYGMVE